MTDYRSSPATAAWIHELPKAELHAHLSGSIRAESIRRLLSKPGNEDIKKRAEGLLDVSTGRTLKQCFELFPIIHELITDTETLHCLVQEVLEDFASENTIYLELRTTPRSSEFFTPRHYLETVLRAVRSYHEQNPDGLVCQVLVSLSRHLPVEEARDTISIVEEFKTCRIRPELGELIVGIELSGNPNKGEWRDFEPILRDCRERLKLPVSLHFGEVLNDAEAMSMLDFTPDRLGHAVLLSKVVQDRLINDNAGVGIEVCLTSNIITKSVSSVENHFVVQKLIPANHPFCLCTDDCGIFDTTLSKEYIKLHECLSLTREKCATIALTGLELRFSKDPRLAVRLQRTFRDKLRRLCSGEGGSCLWIEEVFTRVLSSTASTK